MADEFIISRANEGDQYPRLAEAIESILNDDGEAKVTVVKKCTRTLPMNKLWRKWTEQTADWMNRQGAKIEIKNKDGKVIHSRSVSPQDAHDMFVMHWLGSDEENTREKTGRMQKGRMLYLMEKHSEWSVQKGLLLIYPSDSEYNKLKQESES